MPTESVCTRNGPTRRSRRLPTARGRRRSAGPDHHPASVVTHCPGAPCIPPCGHRSGRAANGQQPCADGLCGRCGDGRASVGPDGEVSPCVFSTRMGVGNVHDAPFGAVLGGPAMAQANAVIRQATRGVSPSRGCGPNSPCGPDNESDEGPDNGECTPGYPGSSCSPRN
ncbi:SPASM domain-containing protein [Streptomyces lavenduligriseus]|uniref:SPASM domain-containing protein n=1 Tax=Streptomyces lavenduligriseus TaxID=67315 RepID=A0ABT0NRI3_9ACTN|nr:SPASM domain-containing protein [Streptomyces lavenduligriseus]MCL3993388.1 SPASM domain-containing protein [Streptomyces lavenduligriseus]